MTIFSGTLKTVKCNYQKLVWSFKRNGINHLKSGHNYFVTRLSWCLIIYTPFCGLITGNPVNRQRGFCIRMVVRAVWSGRTVTLGRTSLARGRTNRQTNRKSIWKQIPKNQKNRCRIPSAKIHFIVCRRFQISRDKTNKWITKFTQTTGMATTFSRQDYSKQKGIRTNQTIYPK